MSARQQNSAMVKILAMASFNLITAATYYLQYATVGRNTGVSNVNTNVPSNATDGDQAAVVNCHPRDHG